MGPDHAGNSNKEEWTLRWVCCCIRIRREDFLVSDHLILCFISDISKWSSGAAPTLKENMVHILWKGTMLDVRFADVLIGSNVQTSWDQHNLERIEQLWFGWHATTAGLEREADKRHRRKTALLTGNAKACFINTCQLLHGTLQEQYQLFVLAAQVQIAAQVCNGRLDAVCLSASIIVLWRTIETWPVVSDCMLTKLFIIIEIEKQIGLHSLAEFVVRSFPVASDSGWDVGESRPDSKYSNHHGTSICQESGWWWPHLFPRSKYALNWFRTLVFLLTRPYTITDQATPNWCVVIWYLFFQRAV